MPISGPFVHHSPDDLSQTITSLAKSTEAGAALVTAAIIDEWLEKLLLAAMRDNLSSNVAERILGSNRPLYELAPKADVAFAFDLIDQTTLDTLRTIKDIRNKFAHTRVLLNFESGEIAKLCQKLPEWKSGADHRTLFDDAAVKCVKAIDAKTQKIIFERAVAPNDTSDNRLEKPSPR